MNEFTYADVYVDVRVYVNEFTFSDMYVYVWVRVHMWMHSPHDEGGMMYSHEFSHVPKLNWSTQMKLMYTN